MLKRISDLLSWIIFSPQCLICKCDVFVDNNLCAQCFNKLHFITQPLCNKCGRPIELDIFSHAECYCTSLLRYYRNVRSALLFDDYASPLIHRFKYADDIKAAATFTKWMLRGGADLIQQADIIAPIPLHISKLRLRKYNQALLLAQGMAKGANIRLIPDLLKRIVATPSQSGLSKRKRINNVRNAFLVKDKYQSQIKDKKIILVDDVITTGATASECARILKAYGACYVDIITLAQTPL